VSMIAKWRAELRAWLLQIVRDAVRLELIAASYANQVPAIKPIAVMPKPASKPLTSQIHEPSFEQMERQALQGQVNFYEPAEPKHIA
jgi:hypothetical protein